MPRLTVLWFGPLREARGVDSETLQTAATTPAALWDELLPDRQRSGTAVALDDELASWADPLAGHGVVAFLPPVAGG